MEALAVVPYLSNIHQADESRCKNIDPINDACIVLELLSHKCRSSSSRLVHEIRSHPRQVNKLLYARCLQDTRVANTRLLQDGRARQSTGGQDHFLCRVDGVEIALDSLARRSSQERWRMTHR